MWTLETFPMCFGLNSKLKGEKVMAYNPMMDRRLQVTLTITETLEFLQQTFDELKRKKK